MLSCHFKNHIPPQMQISRLNVFLSLTTTKSSDPQSLNQQQKRCYTCGETNHLTRYCPKHCKDNSKQPEICRNYKCFQKSNCEEDGNKCSYGQQHKCQRFNKWGCKTTKHTENCPPSTARMTSVPANELNYLRQQLVVPYA